MIMTIKDGHKSLWTGASLGSLVVKNLYDR